MSKKDEALKLALEALESYHGYMEPLTTVFGGPRIPAEQSTTGKVERAITAIREALAEQSADEPVKNVLSTWKSGAIGATEAILELFKHYPSKPSITSAPPTAQHVAPKGYALIGIDALKAWGKYDEVVAACCYPVAEMPQRTDGCTLCGHCAATGERIKPAGEPPVLAELNCVCGAVWEWRNRDWEIMESPQPAAQWVGPTDEEVEIASGDYTEAEGFKHGAHWALEKLKEKNK